MFSTLSIPWEEYNTVSFFYYNLVWRSWSEFVKYLQHQAFNKSDREHIKVEEEMKVLEFHTDGSLIVTEMITVVVD